MITNKDKFEARVYEVATIIKLVATLNVEAVCDVATKLLKNYELDDIDEIDNKIVYDAYCKMEEGI